MPDPVEGARRAGLGSEGGEERSPVIRRASEVPTVVDPGDPETSSGEARKISSMGEAITEVAPVGSARSLSAAPTVRAPHPPTGEDGAPLRGSTPGDRQASAGSDVDTVVGKGPRGSSKEPAPSAGSSPLAAPQGPRAQEQGQNGQGGAQDGSEDEGLYALLHAGLRIQQYELIRELGRGGMGRVYLARDLKLGRRVAIKFLGVESPAVKARFLSEARTTARLSHENIVVIHEVGEWSGLPFMVLELLEGETLRSVIAGRRIGPARAVELMVPVVRALVRAHEADIVHRDLKPENIFLTKSGTVKVLDFGIAKVFAREEPRDVAEPGDVPQMGIQGGASVVGPGPDSVAAPVGALELAHTREGALLGTLTYMAPEQWGMGTVDHRTDLFAVGIMLYEMVSGRHPLGGLSLLELAANASVLERPLPSVVEVVPEIPGDLERLIDRCLAKPKEARFSSAREVLELLEGQLPGRLGWKRSEEEGPYPGLTAFQEADAARFFGRSREILRAVARIREQPMLAVVGQSGVGKSSFVRAGILPTLKASGESWEVLVTRPGRSPLSGLASLLQGLSVTSPSGSHGNPWTPLDAAMAEGEVAPSQRSGKSGDLGRRPSSSLELGTGAPGHEALLARLCVEPGVLGRTLRQRARQKASTILLFVDQFEELYTLVADREERAAYVACLASLADDANSPLRLVVSMRSDLLDRVGEDQTFMDAVTRGLVFLQPLDRQGLREALCQPAELAGYRFESEGMVSEMLDALSDSTGALPLLQFTAAKLWELRDRGRKLLSLESYTVVGGMAGALATHADEILAALTPPQQRLARVLLARLVTAEGTRAIVDMAELAQLAPSTGEAERLVDYLVGARLLVVQRRSEEEGAQVELVHESLIQRWPTLRRWLDESQEETAFLGQLRTAARQWGAKGRPKGLLWRGEAVEEARRFQRRYRGQLPGNEGAYLSAVLALADRASRLWRMATVGVIVILLGLVAVGGLAIIKIRRAERTARRNETTARKETRRSLVAEERIRSQLEELRAKDKTIKTVTSEATTAQGQAADKQAKLDQTEKKLKMSYEQIEGALKDAKAARGEAERALQISRENERKAKDLARAEAEAKKELERLLDRERRQLEAERRARLEAERQRNKLQTTLKR